jgi:hypothetical protein
MGPFANKNSDGVKKNKKVKKKNKLGVNYVEKLK